MIKSNVDYRCVKAVRFKEIVVYKVSRKLGSRRISKAINVFCMNAEIINQTKSMNSAAKFTAWPSKDLRNSIKFDQSSFNIFPNFIAFERYW